MKRELKFKAWHKETGRNGEVVVMNFEGQSAYFVHDGLPYWYAFSELDLMQFTGLLDVAGDEIYEGDILEISNEYFSSIFHIERQVEYVGQVWHDSELAYFHIGDIRLNIIPRKDLSAKYYTKIGNCIENAELLSDAERTKI